MTNYTNGKDKWDYDCIVQTSGHFDGKYRECWRVYDDLDQHYFFGFTYEEAETYLKRLRERRARLLKWLDSLLNIY